VDYSHPVEALIPGVQGRVLAVLARTEAELTMRTVARLAGVSPNRATSILNALIQLGLVERRDAGTAALVRLSRENEASKIVLRLAALPELVLARMTEAAQRITPPPASVTVFGSFARGQARNDSDIDVLVVRPEAVAAEDPGWERTLGEWSDAAARIAGNPLNLLVVSEAELLQLVRRRRSVWDNVVREGLTLVGTNLRQGSAA
jgi:predicted nucleotidyltransferase